MRPFVIPLRGLNTGTHRFEWVVDDGFFAAIDSSLVLGGRGNVVVEAQAPASLSLDMNITGEVKVTCDRCLEPLTLGVAYRGEVAVKSGEGDNDERVLWMAPGDEELDLRQYLYESICLSLPLKWVHEEPAQCNPEMLARIKWEE